jgi:glyoxylase-like metal-dependent hydrolase (beta-lactamase superfamily II)
VPGIRAIPAPGHTVGHTFYAIESKGQKRVVWGDVVHVAAIQFPDPAVSVEYDTDEKQQNRRARPSFLRRRGRDSGSAPRTSRFPALDMWESGRTRSFGFRPNTRRS